MIRSDAGRCPISAQCGILGVAKSTYYWMLEHPEAERADPYEKDVERVWRDSGKVYGARKIKHALGHEGVTLSRRRVNRIMKRNGMASSYSKAAYRPRPARPNDDPAPSILAREFDGYAPRTHLASDPAYVRVGSSWAYVCLPGDLANRQIAGHSVGVRHDADLVPAAFAALRFPLDEIEVFHTDRGGEFTGGTHRTHARRVRHHTFPFQTRQPIRQRGGRIHQPARQEGTHPQERLHERGATTLGRQPVRVVVQPPTAPLDPRIPEPRGVHTTRKNPLETVQHPVANPFKYEIVQLYGNSKDTNGPIATRTKNSNSSKLIFPIPVFKFFARTFYRSIKFFYRTALLIELIGRAYDAGRSTSYNTAFRNILCYDGSTSNNGVRAYYNTWHDKTPPPRYKHHP